MTSSRRFRYRVSFTKTHLMRFTSHLDLHRTWERTLRRARVPLAYTQGFNPRPRINLSTALPLGYTSKCELADIWFDEERLPANLIQDLQHAAPDGLRIEAVELIVDRQPSLQTQITAVEYEVQIEQALPINELRSSVQTLLKAEVLPRRRRGKDYDLRPLIETLKVTLGLKGEPQLKMRLSARESATGRPEEVLLALGLDPTLAQVHRTRLILSKHV